MSRRTRIIYNHDTAIYNAARDNKLNDVVRLLSAGADFNKGVSDTGATPLYIASENGHTEVVKVLIAAGADVNKARTDIGVTPLYIASMNGRKYVVEILIAAGADVNKARTDNGVTPLFIASQNGYKEIVEGLIRAGADVNKARTDSGSTPIFIASQNGHKEIVETLIRAGADYNKAMTTNDIRNNGVTPLYIASQNGHKAVLEVLIAAGADVNKAKTDNGVTPIFMASQNGHKKVVETLIAAGADVNKARTDNGVTPLFIASQNGYKEIVEGLIRAGADVNKSRTDSGTRPLYVASENGHIEVVKRLLAVPGIDLNKVIEAAKQNKFSEEIRKLLLNEKDELWQGWTRGDIERMNEIFDDSMAPNITLCPVCLKTTTRDQGCMHMKHNCKGLRGFYHKRLYDVYNTNNEIHWCTICARIGYGVGTHFEHYKLGLAIQDKPGTHGPTMVFDTDCATRSGGGGLREKLMRFQRVREMALKLNKPRYIGKMTEKAAKEMLVEAMWDAPLIQNPDINEILETKSWIIPNTAFSSNVAKKESNAPNVPMHPTHHDPIVHHEETEQFQNAILVSDKDIIQFRHEGSMHDQEGQQISRDAFFSFLQSIGVNEAKEGFLKCWQYVPEAIRKPGDRHCGVKLYPREVRLALGLKEMPEEGENVAYRTIYELYRKKFNEAAQKGGRRIRTRKRRRRRMT